MGFEGLFDGTTQYITDLKYATTANNFVFENRELTGTIGVAAAKNYAASPVALPAAPSAIKNVFYYKYSKDNVADDRLVIQLVEGSFYYTRLLKSDAWHSFGALKLTGDVMAVNYNYQGVDRMLICSQDNYLYVIEGAGVLYTETAPHFSCFAIHSERLFGGVNGGRPRLWFSDDFDPFNWRVSADEAGFITFDDEYGDILQLVSFGGHLYIFRQYAIFRLTAYTLQSEFTLKTVCSGLGKIVKNSVVMCGDKMVFAAGDSLYVFDGYDVKKLAPNIPKLKKTEGVSGAYLNDMYYLACRTSTRASSMVNDTILRYDFSTRQIAVFTACNALSLTTIRCNGNENVFVTLQDAANQTKLGVMSADGKFMGTATTKTYASTVTHLGVPAEKTVRSITLTATAALKVAVQIDDSQYSFDVTASYYPQTFIIEKKGSLVGVTLTSQAALPHIPPMTIEYSV